MGVIQRYLVPLFTVWCYCSISSNSIEEPLFNLPGLENPAHQKPAYPTYFGIIEEDGTDFQSDFAAAMGYEQEILSLEGFDQVGSPKSSPKVVNVDEYGAKGDGTDDTKAFEKAWDEACSSAPSVLVVPKNKMYLVKQISFSGPCKSNITVLIYGTIQAPSSIREWEGLDQTQWIVFNKVQNLIVEGGGTVDGNGQEWWKNSCKINKSLPCKSAPTGITFDSCTNLKVGNLRIKDSQQIHVSFERCVNVEASNLMVTAPESSPNTDGIHVTDTQNINIMNCVIGTGDDCISIVSGSKNVKATDITCGPGHGISIGSLGAGNSEDHVSQVVVDGANIVGTTNGVRIKTWQGGSGNAQNIIFQNIAMNNVTNPIIIDQNYCDSKDPCKEQDSAVAISDVVYRNIKGTSASEVAMTFDCSKSAPCRGILLQNINLVPKGKGTSKSECRNVIGTTKGMVIPPPCF